MVTATFIPAYARKSSFRFPMLLLATQKRAALMRLYALCRTMDNAIDDAPNLSAAQQALNYWRDQIRAIQEGTPENPVAAAFQPVFLAYRIAPAHLDALIDGFAMDCTGSAFICPDVPALERYCYGVASAVGLISMSIFGCAGPTADRFAIELGHALQLTNILRDWQEDGLRGRCYFPLSWLENHPEPTEIPYTARGKMATLARQRFLAADVAARELPVAAIAPALAMRDVYAAYFQQMEQQAWPSTPNIALSRGAKGKIAGRALGYLLGIFRSVRL